MALRTLLQLSSDESENYPLASQIVKRDFYMDDLLCSLPDVEVARRGYSELVRMFACGNFLLTKWVSNSKVLFSDIPESNRSPKVVRFDSDGLKILGLLWYPGTDEFSFSISSEIRPCTKRNVLSTVARLFDPCGFLSPVTLAIKLFIRRLWILKLDWDESPPHEICEEWEKFLNSIIILQKF